MTANFHTSEDFRSICIQALKAATGKMVMPAGEHALKATAHRVLIRVGLLGPALGGQCVIDIPLLTALNLSALGVCGKNFTSINDDSEENDKYRKLLLGIPQEDSSQVLQCTDAWVKTINIPLGSSQDDEKMNVAVNPPSTQYPNGTLRVKIGEAPAQTYKLDNNNKVSIDLEEKKVIIEVVDITTIKVDFDESFLTLGSVPSQITEQHIIITMDGKQYMVKSASSLVKSRLLELANQVAPSVIPGHLTGDISTPEFIPVKLQHLPLPELQKFETELIIMGVGAIHIIAEMRDIAGLTPRQLNILKGLFNFTFYHPELKKIFG